MDGPDLTPCCLLLSGAMGIQESELCSNSGPGQADILICTQLLICGTSFQILPLEECLGREPGTHLCSHCLAPARGPGILHP